jgi:pimeloyl-ACP methyl ester carboxylesterase
MVDTTVVRDVVIVIPGIMGSELSDANGPVWSVRPGGLARAIRTFGRSIGRLQLPAGIGDEAPKDGIRATALLGSLHVVPGLWSPITGYDGLLAFLRSERFHLVEARADNDGIIPNLICFPYDWRLSNRYNARLLARRAIPALEHWQKQPGMDDAKLVLICHSMGGLIARWFADQEGGAERIRALITIGTPFRGAAKAVRTLVNGLEPGIGPLRASLTGFVRSLPSLYQLLPQYNCLVTDNGRTDLITGRCPGLDADMLRDAADFHRKITGDGKATYALHKVVGIRQPTFTTVRVVGAEAMPSYEIDGLDQGGDGTVPRLAAEPVTGRGVEVHEIAAQHGELQGTRSLLDLVDGILSREAIIWQAATAEGIGIDMRELWSVGEAPHLQVTNLRDRRLWVSVQDELGQTVADRIPVAPDGTASLGPLPESGYRAIVASDRRGGPPPTMKPFLVFDPAGEA